MYVDNNAAVSITNTDSIQNKSRSIGVAVHHIKDHVWKGNIKVVKIDGKLNPVNIFTKPLPIKDHKKCVGEKKGGGGLVGSS